MNLSFFLAAVPDAWDGRPRRGKLHKRGEFIADTFYSAINGILAMPEFREQFASRCSQGEKGSGNFSLCPKDSSIIVAILSAGTALGALLAAPIGDHLGRRRSLLVSVLLFCVGAICQVCANAIPLLLVGR